MIVPVVALIIVKRLPAVVPPRVSAPVVSVPEPTVRVLVPLVAGLEIAVVPVTVKVCPLRTTFLATAPTVGKVILLIGYVSAPLNVRVCAPVVWKVTLIVFPELFILPGYVLLHPVQLAARFQSVAPLTETQEYVAASALFVFKLKNKNPTTKNIANSFIDLIKFFFTI